MVSRCITQLVAACHLFYYHDTAMAVESVANRPLETSDCHQGQRAPDVHITQEQVQELQTECTGLTRVQVARLVKVYNPDHRRPLQRHHRPRPSRIHQNIRHYSTSIPGSATPDANTGMFSAYISCNLVANIRHYSASLPVGTGWPANQADNILLRRVGISTNTAARRTQLGRAPWNNTGK